MEGGRDNDTPAMNDNPTHTSQSMMVHAYIWKVEGIMIHGDE